MTASRDPRVDPRPGDTLRLMGHKRYTEVVGRMGDRVLSHFRRTKNVRESSLLLWQALSARAEIVKVADEPDRSERGMEDCK